MTDLRTAAQQALEALGLAKLNGRSGLHPAEIGEIADAITALQRALAQQAEPVCKCDPRTRLVGDGCEVCNPELAAELAQEQEPLGWAIQIGTHSAGRRQGKPRYVLFFNKADAEDLADRTRGARPEPFYLEGQR